MKACNSCGKCCTKYSDGGLSVTADEIALWEIFNPELMDYVKDGKIWMHPQKGNQLTLCPWLRKVPNKNMYTCDIYEDRPDDCKFYPVTIDQMQNDDCEMLENGDLAQPIKAQLALDGLMSDSRPPLKQR